MFDGIRGVCTLRIRHVGGRQRQRQKQRQKQSFVFYFKLHKYECVSVYVCVWAVVYFSHKTVAFAIVIALTVAHRASLFPLPSLFSPSLWPDTCIARILLHFMCARVCECAQPCVPVCVAIFVVRLCQLVSAAERINKWYSIYCIYMLPVVSLFSHFPASKIFARPLTLFVFAFFGQLCICSR